MVRRKKIRNENSKGSGGSTKRSSPPVPLKKGEASSKDEELNAGIGYFILSVLYLLQGVPVGLCMNTILLLLKPKLSYSEIAMVTLSSYPYSLKLLWSPIVDTYYFKNIGRRKSWIIPTQVLAGLLMIFTGAKFSYWLDNGQENISKITCWTTILVLLFSTQDIAVDGWALTLLPEKKRPHVSVIQSVFLSVGFFLSSTVFLALNSPELPNKFLRSSPADYGLINLASYLKFWGLMLITCSLCLIFLVKERPVKGFHMTRVKDAYLEGLKVLKLPSVSCLVIVLLLCKAPFIGPEDVGALRILEYMPNMYVSLTSILDFPVEIIASYITAVAVRNIKPLELWIKVYYLRLLIVVASLGMFYAIPKMNFGITGYLILFLFQTICSSMARTVQFSATTSFFNVISDDAIGGTYMTLLNTVSNLGGTWPRYFIIRLMDILTVSKCSNHPRVSCLNHGVDSIDILGKDLPSNFSCGKCVLKHDGYFYTSIMSLVFGWIFIKSTSQKLMNLQNMPLSAWKTTGSKKKIR